MRRRRLLPAVLLALLVAAVPALARSDREDWPTIDGVQKLHKKDQSGKLVGTARSDKLLGGHGNDTIEGRDAADVLWGDYKPSGQPSTQRDRISGGGGNDWIYSSHGWNTIDGGTGDDKIRGREGQGIIDCGGGNDVLYVSHASRKRWTIRNCETISYRRING